MSVTSLLRVALGVIVISTSTDLRGQSRAFEVASVKENRSSPPVWNAFIENQRLRIRAINAKELVQFVYGVHADQVFGAKPWMESIRFDIEALSGERLPTMLPTGLPPQVADMIRTLLEERFQLRVLHDTREIPVYALVPVRLENMWGKRIRASSLDCTAHDSRVTTPECWARAGARRTQVRGRSIEALVDYMEGWVKRPVLNETRIAGHVDIDLEWDLGVDSEHSLAARIRAVEDQLGLKLVSRRALMPVVVIERMERPSRN